MELPAPRVYEDPGDEETLPFRKVVIDLPEPMRRHYHNSDMLDIERAIGWRVPFRMDDLLINYAAEVLGLPRTEKGNLKRVDQEIVDNCLHRLRRRIAKTSITGWRRSRATTKSFTSASTKHWQSY